jgi:hypothetical protein
VGRVRTSDGALSGCDRVTRLRAPFPWFGGKSRVGPLVWERFGEVPNYVEPFAGSLAVLLGRVGPVSRQREETVNDVDCWLVNFWRATKAEPNAVAASAEWPISEPDLAARHRWFRESLGLRERIYADPEFYDVRAAGWWVWGICSSIGEAWTRGGEQRPSAFQNGNRRNGLYTTANPAEALERLARRLSHVRILSGDWSRAVSSSRLGSPLSAVFLDPPYGGELVRPYAGQSESVAGEVQAWALEHGDNPALRIALCGLEGEHAMPDGWETVRWEGHGGFGRRTETGRGRDNAARETIWFSPHCLKPSSRFAETDMFASLTE